MKRSFVSPIAAVAVALGAGALHAPALAGQSKGGGALSVLQAGAGIGAGTGRFGGPGVGVIIGVVPAARPLAFGGEVTVVLRREHHAEGGLFFPDPGRVRTLTRWAVTGVAVLDAAWGFRAKAGAGCGTVDDVDTSVLDAAPIASFASFVIIGGIGRRTRVGAVAVTPRLDLLVHAGHGIRATGLLGATVGPF